MKQASDLNAEIEAGFVLRKRPKRSLVSSGENSMDNLIGAVDATCDNGILDTSLLEQNNSHHHPSSSSSSMGAYNSFCSAQLPKEYEDQFLSAIFELGLKNASPKLILPLLPPTTELNTEHIKSHLQKYRVHKERSKEEFVAFYTEHIKQTFDRWDEQRGWESGFGVAGPIDGSYGGIIESKAIIDDNKERGGISHGKGKADHPAAVNQELEDKVKELQRLQAVLNNSSRHVEKWMQICSEAEEQTKGVLAGLSRVRSSVSSSTKTDK